MGLFGPHITTAQYSRTRVGGPTLYFWHWHYAGSSKLTRPHTDQPRDDRCPSIHSHGSSPFAPSSATASDVVLPHAQTVRLAADRAPRYVEPSEICGEGALLLLMCTAQVRTANNNGLGMIWQRRATHSRASRRNSVLGCYERARCCWFPEDRSWSAAYQTHTSGSAGLSRWAVP